ncbi:MAG: LemA family protein [Chthoniobacterales bacterium]
MKSVLGVLLAIIGVIVLVVVFLAFTLWGSYNGLVTSQQLVENSWADVQNVYQRRADLIPNLVKTVEGAANFEKSTLIDVTKARQQVSNVKINPADPQALQQFQQSQDALSGALSRLLVVVERYPDLKANANFLALQTQLEGTENRIAVERRKFNGAVKDYNISIKRVPTVFFAAMMGFTPRPYFSANPGAENAPDVNFNFGGGNATKGDASANGNSAPPAPSPTPKFIVTPTPAN